MCNKDDGGVEEQIKMEEKKNRGELETPLKLSIMVDIAKDTFGWAKVTLTLWLRKEKAMDVWLWYPLCNEEEEKEVCA